MTEYVEISGKRVTVIGFGRSGLSAAKVLYDKGARVTVTDCLTEVELREQIEKLGGRDVKLCLGGDGVEAVENAEIVVLSPGVPPSVPSVRAADERRIPVISEVELFSWYSDNPVIAVTGTNGKSTTVTLVAKLLHDLGYKTRLAGNIGFPLTELIGTVEPEENVVAEISSFQLERIQRFHPHISVILNITPDHLDRYETFRDYVLAKKRILENQCRTDFAILNSDDVEVKKLAEEAEVSVIPYSTTRTLQQGVFVDSGKMVGRIDGDTREICSVRDIRMKGAHNIGNCLAAVAVGLIYGGDTHAIAATISQFQGLEHRLEYVRTVGGVEFYNDSKATNVEAVVEALKSFDSPIVLICGGRDKGCGYRLLREAASGKVKRAVLIGEARGELRKALSGAVSLTEEESFHSAFRSACSASSHGDVVLLSPACSSFDMFRDFEERGRLFKAEVENHWKEFS